MEPINGPEAMTEGRKRSRLASYADRTADTVRNRSEEGAQPQRPHGGRVSRHGGRPATYNLRNTVCVHSLINFNLLDRTVSFM